MAGSLLFLIGLPPIIFVLLLIYGATFSASFLGFGFSLLIGGIISIALILTSVIAGRVHTLLAIVLALCSLTTLLVVGMVAIPSNLTGGNPISTAALIALIFGPMGSLPGISLSGKHPIHPIRPVSWSWTRIHFAFLVGLVGSVIVGGLVVLLIGWENGIGIGSIIGFCCILPMSLFIVRLEEPIQPSIYPNKGIRNSL